MSWLCSAPARQFGKTSTAASSVKGGAWLKGPLGEIAATGGARSLHRLQRLPASPAVHEIARSRSPGARVLHVDNDPTAIVHTRALLMREGVAVAAGDAGAPGALLSGRRARHRGHRAVPGERYPRGDGLWSCVSAHHRRSPAGESSSQGADAGRMMEKRSAIRRCPGGWR